MTSKELVNECKRRGLKPYLGGKKWNHSHVMRCKLRDDDAAKKKSYPLSRMPKHKSDFARGLEVMMNDPRTSPFTSEGAKVFKEVISASELPLTEALKYIGKGKKKVKGPTDKEKSEQRIEKLEETKKE